MSTTDELNELMPVRQGAANRWWIQCPWCLDGFDSDRAWRCYRWRVDHICTDDAPLHVEAQSFISPK